MGSNKLSHGSFCLISGLLTSYTVFVGMIPFSPSSQQKMWDTETWTFRQLTFVSTLLCFISDFSSSIVFLRWVSGWNPSMLFVLGVYFFFFFFEFSSVNVHIWKHIGNLWSFPGHHPWDVPCCESVARRCSCMWMYKQHEPGRVLWPGGWRASVPEAKVPSTLLPLEQQNWSKPKLEQGVC